MGRVGSFLFALGAVQIVTNAAAIEMLDRRQLTAAATAFVCAALMWAVPWTRLDVRWFHPLIALGSAFPLTYITPNHSPLILVMFLFSLGFAVYFFWDSPRALMPQVALNVALYIYAATIIADTSALTPRHERFWVGTAMLPVLLGLVGMIGWSGNRTRRLHAEERRRHLSTVEALAGAIEARDGYTGAHSAATLTLVELVCDQFELTESERSHTLEVALLHDIGKIGIPNEILHCGESLSEEQWTLMRRHPEIGEQIVARVSGMEEVARAIRHEHEHWDGSGYPDGLTGAEIPFASRVVLCCDAFHAMTDDRPYRRAMSVMRARAELIAGRGIQFDPSVVDAFLAAYDHAILTRAAGLSADTRGAR